MSNTKDAMNEQLGQAKILPLLVRLAIPATAAQLVNALYSIVDRMYIGHMPGDGTLALSGIGLTFPITMLIAAFSCLPGMGGAPLASIALGEGNQKKAQKYLCNAITLLLAISVVMMAVCLLFLEPLLVLFGADAETLPYASQYLTIYLPSSMESASSQRPSFVIPIRTRSYFSLSRAFMIVSPDIQETSCSED